MAARKYGDATIAARLAEARYAAGHGSMQKAATAAGVAAGTYKAHERGLRMISDVALETYARAFGVDPQWLRLGGESGRAAPEAIASDVKGPSAPPPNTQLSLASCRLSVARIIAGFTTRSEAVRFFGWVKSTYVAHEAFTAPLNRQWAALYGSAFGISASWLLDGALPSGLPAEVEDLVIQKEELAVRINRGRQSSHPWNVRDLQPQLIHFQDASRRGNVRSVKQLWKWQASGRLLERVLAQKQAIAFALENPLTHSSLEEARAWGFPSSFLREVGAVPSSIAVIPARSDFQGYDISAGDLLIVEMISASIKTDGLVLCEQDGNQSICNGRPFAEEAADTDGIDLVGRILGRISKFSTRS